MNRISKSMIATFCMALIVVVGIAGLVIGLSYFAFFRPMEQVPIELETDILRINPKHLAAFEKLINASADLIAAGVPLVDFGYRVGRVVEDYGDDIVIYGYADLVIEVGLKEVEDEYKDLIKAKVGEVEGIEFDFFQARFTQKQISRWQDDIFETFWVGTRPLPPGAIDVPVFGTASSWREQKIWIQIEEEVKPEYIEAIRMVVGEEAPLEFIEQISPPPPAEKVVLPLNAVRKVDDIIGGKRVEYWVHIIEGIEIKNDYILIHRDVDTGKVIKYYKNWREVELPDVELKPFTPPGGDYSWKRAVAFLNNTDPGHFYTFYDIPEFPLICWEVRYADGTTGMYDLNGNRIGRGIPVPSR